MKKQIKICRTLVTICLAATAITIVGCQKENLTTAGINSENQASSIVTVGSQPSVADIASLLAQIEADDTSIYIGIKDGSMSYTYGDQMPSCKKEPDAIFKTVEEAANWAYEMIFKGYDVSVAYDEEKQVFECRILNKEE